MLPVWVASPELPSQVAATWARHFRKHSAQWHHTPVWVAGREQFPASLAWGRPVRRSVTEELAECWAKTAPRPSRRACVLPVEVAFAVDHIPVKCNPFPAVVEADHTFAGVGNPIPEAVPSVVPHWGRNNRNDTDSAAASSAAAWPVRRRSLSEVLPPESSLCRLL